MDDKFFEDLAAELQAFAASEQGILFSALQNSGASSKTLNEIGAVQNRNLLELVLKLGFLINNGKPSLENIFSLSVAATDNDAVQAPECHSVTRKGLLGRLFNRVPKNNKDPDKRFGSFLFGKYYVRYKNSLGEEVFQVFSDETQAKSYAKLCGGVYGSF